MPSARFHRRGPFLATLWAACLCPGVTAQVARPEGHGFDEEELTTFVTDFIREHGIPGAVVSVAGPTGTLYEQGFGTDDGRAISPDDLFHIGSVSKGITALAIVQLAEHGRLGLDDRVSQHLGDFAVEGGETVTIRHLLTHTSGLRTWDAFDRDAQHHGRTEHLTLHAPPGEAPAYSSLNYLLLGRIVEEASGRAYADYVQNRLFRPLGMTSSRADSVDADALGVVRGHSFFFGWPVPRREPAFTKLMIPAGYIVTTASDMGRYMSFLLGSLGSTREPPPVLPPPRAVEEMFRPADGDTGNGLGWGVVRWNGQIVYYHAGMTPGFYANVVLLPEARRGITVITSRNAGPFLPAPRDLTDGIVRRVTDQERVSYAPRERWINLGLLAAFLFAIGRFLMIGNRWRKAGSPLRIRPRPKVLLALTADLLLSVGVAVWVLVWFAKMPLAGMLEFYPDLGILLAMALILGPVEAWAKATLRPTSRAPAGLESPGV